MGWDEHFVPIAAWPWDLSVGSSPVRGLPLGADEFIEQMREREVERIVFDSGLTERELARFVAILAANAKELASAGGLEARMASAGLEHVSTGRIHVPSDASQVSLSDAADDSADPIEPSSDVFMAVQNLFGQAAAAQMGAEEVDALSDRLVEVAVANRFPLTALAKIKRHDDYTFTHAINVAILTVAQGEKLDLERDTLRDFAIAGLLHDIGKLKVPGDILRKPGKLTDAEFDQIKRHPLEGAKILCSYQDIPEIAAVAAFEHHLKFDRSGYPRTRRNRELNLCSLLVTIADVYDALRSSRHYRSEMQSHQIRKILADGSGADFHALLLDNFLAMTDRTESALGVHPIDASQGQVLAVLS